MKTAINETRKAQGKDEMSAKEMLAKIKEKSQLLEIDKGFLSRSLNEGFLEERKSVMKSFKWQC